MCGILFILELRPSQLKLGLYVYFVLTLNCMLFFIFLGFAYLKAPVFILCIGVLQWTVLCLTCIILSVRLWILIMVYWFQISIALLTFCPLYLQFFLAEIVKWTSTMNKELGFCTRVFYVLNRRYKSIMNAAEIVIFRLISHVKYQYFFELVLMNPKHLY